MRQAEQSPGRTMATRRLFQVAVEPGAPAFRSAPARWERGHGRAGSGQLCPGQAKRAAETAQGRLDVAVDTIADEALPLWQPDDALARCNRRFWICFPIWAALSPQPAILRFCRHAVVSDGAACQAATTRWLAAAPRPPTTANPKAA